MNEIAWVFESRQLNHTALVCIIDAVMSLFITVKLL